MISRISRQVIRTSKLSFTLRMIAPFCKVSGSDDGHNHDHNHSHPDFQPKQKEQSQFSQEQIQSKIDEITKIVKNNKIALFMKGTPIQPMCGYSNYAVEVLKFYKVNEYHAVDVLADPLMREQIKIYSNWPTFPQLYVNGELIGGCDIMMEMHKENTLSELFQKAK